MEVRKRATFATPEEVLARPALKTMVCVCVPLEHADARSVAASLAPVVQSDQSGVNMDQIVAVTSGNSVVIRGFRDTVAEMIRLVQKLDRPSPKLTPTLEERFQQIEKRLPAEAGAKKQ